MKLHYKIPEPNKYALSVSLITNNSGVLLWESDTRDNSKTKELNITVCTTPQKITIQGQNFYPGKSGVDEEILIFHVSFHRLSTTEAITSTAQNVTSFCADTDTTTSDNWFSSRVNEDSMTTTSTLQSSDGLTTTATVVGVVVVALILLIITVVVFLRQKKKKYKKNVPASDVPPLDVNIAHPPEYPYLAASSTSVMITPTRDPIQNNTVHQEPEHVTTYSVVVNTDSAHCHPEHPHGLSPDKCLAAQDDRLVVRTKSAWTRQLDMTKVTTNMCRILLMKLSLVRLEVPAPQRCLLTTSTTTHMTVSTSSLVVMVKVEEVYTPLWLLKTPTVICRARSTTDLMGRVTAIKTHI
ncbi:uncharacterized protein LOC112559050 [Pomacea canaliculata]|uniref:uncharacterized protein LOC112559050 n=1 Tax=Pomacea canaliculata TaxID=400727 RepID=UPI000D726386|nr:uncharacterized protein LOC112559050 [Pomacea canaliculata]XP_025085701.1 uncharacterized protein LOC112559050 [Pomacea canaliculata]